ncbi:MAG: hypothetical protein JNM25_11110 [Planctomycetes bacterium]|nr:hypothetical protein [Planctomycetota bacterium]
MMAQGQGVYSTHDSTAGSAGPEPIDQFRETWADVKTPGDDFQYSVGTIEVRTTMPGALFSGVAAITLLEPPLLTFPPDVNLVPGQRKQVVIVQCTRALPQAANPATFQEIVWQRYYYGGTAQGEPSDRATNARGIAVWPTGDPDTTRIAICGETYDERIPGAPDTFPAATAFAPTGFLAVLDGNGTLLWSRHFFGVDPANSCAITDLSIRVEPDGRETVTYCGISSHGDPGPGTTLTLQQQSVLPAGLAGEWDGIVGRVSSSAAGVNPEFHANVDLGGNARDGLFGLARSTSTTPHSRSSIGSWSSVRLLRSDQASMAV